MVPSSLSIPVVCQAIQNHRPATRPVIEHGEPRAGLQGRRDERRRGDRPDRFPGLMLLRCQRSVRHETVHVVVAVGQGHCAVRRRRRRERIHGHEKKKEAVRKVRYMASSACTQLSLLVVVPPLPASPPSGHSVRKMPESRGTGMALAGGAPQT